jgi:hypothetical protein
MRHNRFASNPDPPNIRARALARTGPCWDGDGVYLEKPQNTSRIMPSNLSVRVSPTR